MKDLALKCLPKAKRFSLKSIRSRWFTHFWDKEVQKYFAPEKRRAPHLLHSTRSKQIWNARSLSSSDKRGDMYDNVTNVYLLCFVGEGVRKGGERRYWSWNKNSGFLNGKQFFFLSLLLCEWEKESSTFRGLHFDSLEIYPLLIRVRDDIHPDLRVRRGSPSGSWHKHP